MCAISIIHYPWEKWMCLLIYFPFMYTMCKELPWEESKLFFFILLLVFRHMRFLFVLILVFKSDLLFWSASFKVYLTFLCVVKSRIHIFRSAASSILKLKFVFVMISTVLNKLKLEDPVWCVSTVLFSKFSFLHKVKYWLSYFLNSPSHYASD